MAPRDVSFSRNIRLAHPVGGQEELDAVARVLASGHWTNGPETELFETEFAALHQARHGIAVANGTVALVSMLIAIGVEPGDEVIVPALTFISTATAVLHVGATPVFAEIDPRTYNLDAADVHRRITSRTRAVLVVHYAGQPARLDSLRMLADEAGVHLLEDAAQAHGASYDGRPVGTWGTAAMFSFTPTKNISMGEGGLITTNDAEVARRCRLLRNHGQSAPYVHESLGWNWRLSEFQAAIGRVQLRRLSQILETKRRNAALMAELLSSVDGIRPPNVAPEAEPVHMLYTCWIDENRDEVLRDLLRAGIEARIYFPPVHQQPVFAALRVRLPVTEEVCRHILSLPFHSQLSPLEIEYIVGSLDAAIGTPS